MKRLSVEEVKTVQLQILKYVQDFCISHDIRFWIDCGSLLGAVRHKGYIPWDDDIDLGMLRPDYDRFISEFSKEENFYKCCCIENDPKHCYPIAKVADTRTVLYEPDESGTKFHINIDIFVYDNAPNDPKILEKMFKKRDRLLWLRDSRYIKCESDKFYKAFLKTVYKALLHLLPENYFDKQIIKNSKRFKNAKTDRVGNFCSYTKMVCDKAFFEDTVFLDFENMKVKAPIEYDKYLKGFYGDYMKLPPIEKQVTHHTYVAYSLD